MLPGYVLSLSYLTLACVAPPVPGDGAAVGKEVAYMAEIRVYGTVGQKAGTLTKLQQMARQLTRLAPIPQNVARLHRPAI